MRAILPLDFLLVNQPEVRFVNQGCALQGVPRGFPPQIRRRECAQLVVHGGHKPIQSVYITARPLFQQDGDIGVGHPVSGLAQALARNGDLAYPTREAGLRGA
jgi:hypothetical protein